MHNIVHNMHASQEKSSCTILRFSNKTAHFNLFSTMPNLSKSRSPSQTMPVSPSRAESETPVMQAIASIESQIASGRLVPGQRLVETDLSEELGIARGRVREALRILSGSGIVELIPFKGARVKRMEQDEISALFRTITGLYCTAIVSLSFEYPRVAAADRRKFQTLSRTLTQAARHGSLDQLIKANNAYLAETNRLCRNPHIEKLMSELHMSIFYKHYSDFVPEAMIRNSMAMADRVHEAVVENNPTKTVSIVWKSIEPIVNHLLSNLDDRQSKPKRKPRSQ